jgi:hypothetical protein
VASNPAVLSSLMPGANISGNSVAVPPMPMSTGTPSVGGNTNPFLPQIASGQAMPPATSHTGATPNTTGSTPTPGTGAPAPLATSGATAGLAGGGNNFGSTGSLQSLIKGLEKSGLTGGVASALAQFMKSGAGFNPEVANALINAMGPSIERGTENIAEQFSAMGNRFGSPAAVGMGDFMSQVNLNIGEIFSQLYEQSVQNYLEVLMGAGKKSPTFGTTFQQNLAAGLGQGVAGLVTG